MWWYGRGNSDGSWPPDFPRFQRFGPSPSPNLELPSTHILGLVGQNHNNIVNKIIIFLIFVQYY